MNNGFYTPELGQDKPDRIIEARLSRNCYRIKWADADHVAAMEAIKALRIRPSNPDAFVACGGPRDGMLLHAANISPSAHLKLVKAGLVATECLLD